MRLCFAEGFGDLSESLDTFFFLSRSGSSDGRNSVLAISCYREENFVWLNVWELIPEGFCLEWLMVEASVEGVSFVECLYEWVRGGGTIKMAEAEGRSYDFVLLKQPSLFSERSSTSQVLRDLNSETHYSQ